MTSAKAGRAGTVALLAKVNARQGAKTAESAGGGKKRKSNH